MVFDTFIGGVKHGGLNSQRHIKILLCYLINSVEKPLAEQEIKDALIGEELVNYFELANMLSEMLSEELVAKDGENYRILANGQHIAEALFSEVPITIREVALKSAIRVQRFAYKSATNKARTERLKDGSFNVHCSLHDQGDVIFSFCINLPDEMSADFVCNHFVEKGDSVYALMLAGVTGNFDLSRRALEILQSDVIK